ncbi:MAG: ABC transporter substrate-binding protein [Beutenbergiaceae bacterium]
MIRNRRWVSLVGAASALALLAACNGGSDGGDGGGGDGGGDPESGSIVWWSWTPDTYVADAYIAAFNEEYPDISIEYTNYENVDYVPAMQTAMQTGQGPDIFALAPGGNSGRPVLGPYAMDLSDIAEEAFGSGWQDNFATGYVDAMTYEDRVVGLPLGGVAAGVLWINKNLFDEHGVSTELNTYDDLKNACDTFAAAGVTCWTMGASDMQGFVAETLRTIVNSYDPGFYQRAMTGETSWDDPALIAGLDMIRQMQADGIIAQDATSIRQYPEANNNFLSGSAAIVQMGTWYTQYAKIETMTASMEGAGVANPEPFVMMPIPSPDFAGDGNPSQLFGETDYGMAISAESADNAAAATFITWLTGTETGQQQVSNAIDLLPALKGVQPQWEDLGLVDPEVQIPVFSQLFEDAADPAETRNMNLTPETNNALVIAVQQALAEPSMSTAEIAAQVEADAVDSGE